MAEEEEEGGVKAAGAVSSEAGLLVVVEGFEEGIGISADWACRL